MLALLMSFFGVFGVTGAVGGSSKGGSQKPLPTVVDDRDKHGPVVDGPVDDVVDVVVDDGPVDDGTDGGDDHGPVVDVVVDDVVDDPVDDGPVDDVVDVVVDDGPVDDGTDGAVDDGTDGTVDDAPVDDGTDVIVEDGSGDGGSITLPETPEEIEAFVTAAKNRPEENSHEPGSEMSEEHMAALDLVARPEATHVAIGSGAWDDPDNWYGGNVPGDGAKVLIPEGVKLTYDQVSDARLFTVRVDGELDFATDTDSQMIVDTLVVSPIGSMTIGTAENPVDPDVDVDIIFANNGPIDTNWDPMLLSRGMIAHGKVEINGAEKESHYKVFEDPQAGDTWIDLGTEPQGWAVGDTIVIAGTEYDGYWGTEAQYGYVESQDEVRVITAIEDGMIFFDEPLVYDHDTPRDDLKTSVANYTRNVSFETENAETAEIYERGHVMFMQNDDVDVRYAEFKELGRTDKSENAQDASEVDNIQFDTNVKARYGLHFHKSGVDDLDDPAMAVGNAVFGSPGWGVVQHDSNAILENNATYNTFGAGFVSESGNETGAWIDNIAILAQGVSWKTPKNANDGESIENFDLGKSGDGFWFQSRMIEATGNVAASVNNGYVYFHRGPLGEKGQLGFDSNVSVFGDALSNDPFTISDQMPIVGFSDNETFASKSGLYVVKGDSLQGHDVHSVLEDFTAWNVREGATLEYTSHYILRNFDLVGRDATAFGDDGRFGIMFGNNVSDMVISDANIENFDIGVDLNKGFTGGIESELHSYTVINGTFSDVDSEYVNYDPTQDLIITDADLPMLEPDLVLDGPLTYKDGNQWDPNAEPGVGILEIDGTKTDSLGVDDFDHGVDDFVLDRSQVVATMEENGYFTTSDGQNYFMLDIYFSDRVSGDIYYETHPVWLDDNVALGTGNGFYANVAFNGVQDLGGADDPTVDSATLWAVLTGGKIDLTEDGYAKLDPLDPLNPLNPPETPVDEFDVMH